MGFRLAVGLLGASEPALGLLLEVAPVLKVRGRMLSVIKLDPMTDNAAICARTRMLVSVSKSYLSFCHKDYERGKRRLELTC